MEYFDQIKGVKQLYHAVSSAAFPNIVEELKASLERDVEEFVPRPEEGWLWDELTVYIPSLVFSHDEETKAPEIRSHIRSVPTAHEGYDQLLEHPNVMCLSNGLSVNLTRQHTFSTGARLKLYTQIRAPYPPDVELALRQLGIMREETYSHSRSYTETVVSCRVDR